MLRFVINGLVDNYEKRAFQLEQVNNQIGELFKEAGISIPTGTIFTFTVNPNDFSVSVSVQRMSYFFVKLSSF